ncbi:MAG: DUF805 domain-containing protein [Brevundimonas sp.]|uniref:DUF805 domain-containing protein n=1 Tax=Brevundimonas sp. TaxID=1871086 RepID=UPI002718700A|nr:DUF805 domain-containing protein [Brevundimonas sp.]MDO9077341.1 DUF805 domain-containing protein [Brevundimonas sp.]MDP3080050.1 DUF805 domain-containing protein [Brevundimonas sp.]MDZ4059957.1 DUF805 domain-containing protein [Brevundimonas sp.]
MANPIIRGFRGIARFSGRDTRGQFWPYAGVVFALIFLGFGIVMSLVMNSMFAEMQAFAVAHPEAATVQSSPGSYSIAIDASHPEAPMPDLGPFFAVMAAMALTAISLLAAAVSRRLHDSGRRAFWGLMPVPFLLLGVTAFPMIISQFMASDTPNLGLFFLLFFNNLLYLIALASLVILLALRGTRGPNRFGPEAV